jgi:hypothetical protein
VRKQLSVPAVIGAGLLFAATAYADPYNPGEQAITGGLLGAGTGAVIGPSPAGAMVLASVRQWGEVWAR